MSFHLLAYYTAPGATASDLDLTPVTDNVVSIVNGHFFPQQDTRLIFASAMTTNFDRIRITQPSLRLITLPYIRPIIDSLVPASLDRVADYTSNPLRIRGLEELGLEATQSSGNADIGAVVAIQETYEAPPTGDIYTLRGTSGTSAVGDTWTTISITWNDQLPDGVYAVVGFNGIGANCLAYRLIFEGQTWRPGCLGYPADSDIPDKIFEWGRLGTWGRFRQTAMPQVQVLSNTTTGTHEVYLQIVKVG